MDRLRTTVAYRVVDGRPVCYTMGAMKMHASKSIEALRARFRREWLLIAVDEVDAATTTPVRGRLLAHSPHRDELYAKERAVRGLTLTVYSEDHLPQGYAAAF